MNEGFVSLANITKSLLIVIGNLLHVLLQAARCLLFPTAISRLDSDFFTLYFTTYPTFKVPFQKR
jgi:hypothetical protein